MTRLRRYEENVELIFKILYFLLAAGTFCPFIYDSSLQPILVKMVLGVGGILLFLRAADWKHYIRMPGLSWMALFVLSFLLSSFMNRRYGMSENFKWMIWMILQMGCLLLCCSFSAVRKEYIFHTIRPVLPVHSHYQASSCDTD